MPIDIGARIRRDHNNSQHIFGNDLLPNALARSPRIDKSADQERPQVQSLQRSVSGEPTQEWNALQLLSHQPWHPTIDG